MKTKTSDYILDIKPTADRIFRKMVKKNRKRLIMIHKKIKEIRSNPNHEYKYLKKPLQTFNRVHIDTHFVLVFKPEFDSLRIFELKFRFTQN